MRCAGGGVAIVNTLKFSLFSGTLRSIVVFNQNMTHIVVYDIFINYDKKKIKVYKFGANNNAGKELHK